MRPHPPPPATVSSRGTANAEKLGAPCHPFHIILRSISDFSVYIIKKWLFFCLHHEMMSSMTCLYVFIISCTWHFFGIWEAVNKLLNERTLCVLQCVLNKLHKFKLLAQDRVKSDRKFCLVSPLDTPELEASVSLISERDYCYLPHTLLRTLRKTIQIKHFAQCPAPRKHSKIVTIISDKGTIPSFRDVDSAVLVS